MKKIFWMITFFCLFGFFSMEVKAGDINSAEAALLSVAGGTYEKNGYYWRVKSEYLSQGAAALSRDDVDLSDSQAASYISQFYSYIGNTTYFDKVGEVPKNTPVPEEILPEEALPEGTETEKSVQSGTVVHSPYTVDAMSAIMHVVDTPSLNVRKEAYSDAELLGVLHEGDEVTVTGVASNGWIQIDYNGATGFVYGRYLEKEAAEEDVVSFEDIKETVEEIESIAQTDKEAAKEKLDTVIDEQIQKTSSAQEDSQEEAEGKDYSDATPMQRQIKLEIIAIIIMAIVIAALVIVVVIQNKKNLKIKK